MLYRLIKILARLSLLFFFRRKIVCGRVLQQLKGPAIIAANHPDSLMDAVVIGCTCTQQVHFTIRSDMFNNRLFRFLLNRLNGIPVYRSSEEKEKLRENFGTIEHCKKILQNNGIIIVFAEGQTLHDWNLKPIKSGVSKIVRHAISDASLKDRLVVLPVGLTYSDFEHPGKTIIIQPGENIYPGLINAQLSDGMWKQAFNSILFQKMEPLIPCMRSQKKENIRAWQTVISSFNQPYTCNNLYALHQIGNLIEGSGSADLMSITRQYSRKGRKGFYKTLIYFLLLIVPGIAGIILNGLYYFPISRWAFYKTRNSIFYDALLCGLITVTYPLYMLLAAAILHAAGWLHFLLWVPVLPLSGWCAMYAYTLLREMKNQSNTRAGS
ncbi:MAG: 1-acyl-sn-glycerol-3-phosphate acyltransferase [Chitinophagaceae bacterium]|nr:1-acyl-sn-glycerol-3-phosphate acyltransferase [Chitinophagaceae bacterium]